jgi:prophage regulatory protein
MVFFLTTKPSMIMGIPGFPRPFFKEIVVETDAKPKLLRRQDVEHRVGISRSTLYDKMNPKNAGHDPHFPLPIRIGATSVRWIEAEVDAWIASRPRTRSIIEEE